MGNHTTISKTQPISQKAHTELQTNLKTEIDKLPFKPPCKKADINNRFTIQDRELDRLVAKYDTRKISIDATGIGKKTVEDAIKRYGEWRVQGIDMTNTAQYELATGGRQAMESKLVKIPRDRATLKDLDKIRRTITPTGKISFRAQRDKEGHADRSWAYMLAIQAAQLPELIFPEFGSDTDHIDPHNNTLDWMF